MPPRTFQDRLATLLRERTGVLHPGQSVNLDSILSAIAAFVGEVDAARRDDIAKLTQEIAEFRAAPRGRTDDFAPMHPRAPTRAEVSEPAPDLFAAPPTRSSWLES